MAIDSYRSHHLLKWIQNIYTNTILYTYVYKICTHQKNIDVETSWNKFNFLQVKIILSWCYKLPLNITPTYNNITTKT